MSEKQGLTYKGAGVDIDAGAELVNLIKPDIARTNRPGVLGGFGGFGGLFELPSGRFNHPVLVSGTDGVGTKLMLANTLNRHETIGIDLVAMCVNDILVCGAEPLFFLDYYATGKLDVQNSREIISGIADGCVQAGAALIGGETAEMPGMYAADEYDLAGFAVGVVEKSRILDSKTVKPGDAILGITSSGCHSNGYSLIRKVLEQSGDDPGMLIDTVPLASHLMAPTRIYVKSILALLNEIPVAALAHITGGGITDNIPRSLPVGTDAYIDLADIQRPGVFNWLEQRGNISREEMLRTFNCGIGMAVIVAKEQADQSIALLESHGESVRKIGEVTRARDTNPPRVLYGQANG